MGCGRESSSSGEHGKSKSCVCDVVRAILEIQNQAVNNECSTCTTNCYLEPLGGIVSPARTSADTRVFTLLNKDGTPFLATFSSGTPGPCASIYFRVEDVFNGCCATLRVLRPFNESGAVNILNSSGTAVDFRTLCNVDYFLPSDSCVTVDLDCFCAVQCIKDENLGICN